MNIFDKFIRIDDSDCISGLTKELKAVYIYNKFLASKKSVLVVTDSLYESNLLYTSINNYTEDVLLFPMDDFLTSEALAVSPELMMTRLETLNTSLNNKSMIVVTNLMGYLRYLPTKDNYGKATINLDKNKDYKIDQLVDDLFNLGYTRETIVTKTGEIAVRGFVVDVFPILASNPIRIEFWGDTIDSIREFDVDTQRTISTLDNIQIKPTTEFIAPNAPFENRKQKYLANYTDIASIKDYFDNPLVIFNDYNEILTGYQLLYDSIVEYGKSVEESVKTSYMFNFNDIHNKDVVYLMPFDNKLPNLKNYNVASFEIPNFTGKIDDINYRLNKYIDDGKTLIICLTNRYQVNKVIEELNNPYIVQADLDDIKINRINVVVKHIQEGFEIDDYVVISENEIFNRKDNNSIYKTKFKIGTKINDISKLNPGDYVVHSLYGIGRYVGLATLDKDGYKKDYLKVEYQGDDKLYIPVEKLELITKYASNGGNAPKLNKLGSTEWAKTKLRVKKKIEDMTGELLELYAKREASQGFAFAPDDEMQIEFEKEFPYEDTLDQIKVTQEIKRDMEDSHPMDRLLCGDVGFGKTEIAFRAVFKAVLSGKQAALLCPTTILSQQHYNNAVERFKNFPVRIALLNRFTSPKKTQQILQDLQDGKIDFLIGTHRILSSDIKFKDIGLLVVDEEQRFGVKHKEKIKEFKNNVDVLTLSATPIPRTLQMSMTGLRSLSLIETPPINRYPIQTYVTAENKEIIKDAIYKEISRGGQVFILFNNIVDMETKAREITSLVPEAKIIIAHGQMNKYDLENVMIKFINDEYNVLLCTTIIETGIDIPNVNTLIIYDANNFGLSQLYQIRGRVGRSDKIAYCYLMYNPKKMLSEIATKRLNAIKEFTSLGSGFAIAMRDLSIRGAGDILGKEQAGYVDSVGIELFMTMLNEEMARLKGEPIKQEETISASEPLINIETAIDSKYVNEEDLKIEIHKKISSIDSVDDIQNIKSELEDRFGIVTDNMIIYMYEEYFEKLARELNISKVNQTKNYIEVILDKKLTQKINGELLFDNVTNISRMFRFKNSFGNLAIILDTVKLDKHFIYYLIDLMNAIKKSLK
jgi:transcription-repair coupling factor (superfamily II helicase)